MTVGRSWRTPAKHGLLRSFVGQEVGVVNRSNAHASIDRLVWIDLTAGDAVKADDDTWRRSCSPGILAYHALHSTKPVDIVLHEIQPATYDRLLTNLAEYLPGLGYEKDGENYWRLGDHISIQAVNVSGAVADVSYLLPSDAVLVFNDPNAITEWAMRPKFAQEVKDRGVWCFRSLSTLGCNPAGIKRIDLEDGSGDAKRERRAWFDLVAAQQGALPDYRDLLLAGIERDDAQWAYLFNTAQKWRASTENVVRTEFNKINRQTTASWYRADAHAFEQAKRFLFLTKKERESGID